MNYKVIKTLANMDLLLCQGVGKMSRRIQKFQRIVGAPPEEAKMSHIAGITKHLTDIMVHETTTLNKWAAKSGVQQNIIHTWLENYNGNVWVRRANFKVVLGDDIRFIIDHENMPYESGIPGALDLILAGLRFHKYIQRWFPGYDPLRFTSVPNCGELMADRLRAHGKLDPTTATHRLPPWMFVSRIDKLLNVEYGPMIQLKGTNRLPST